jgi:hypothetical protein
LGMWPAGRLRAHEGARYFTGGGIRYALLLVRERRRVNNTTSGRWIAQVPGVKWQRFSPCCAPFVAPSVCGGKRRFFEAKSRKGRRPLRLECPAPRHPPPMLVWPSQLHSRSAPYCQDWPCALASQELRTREGHNAVMGILLWEVQPGGAGRSKL